MIQLRPNQENLIALIRKAILQGHTRIVMQAATGFGKTITFSFMLKESAKRVKRCLILTNRIELLTQAGGTFDKLNIDYANITAKTKAIPASLVVVAMVETMKRRAKARLDFSMYLKTIDLLIIDECHIAAFDDLFQYLSESCIVIGATATPIRQNAKKPLSDHYTVLVEGVSISELINQRFLSKPKYYGVSVDLSKVKMKAGEYDERDQEKLFSETKVFEGLKENLQLHAKGLKTMIFCPSVASSLKVAKELNCLHVDGTMSPDDRDRVLRKFENTPAAVITNCAITTTGYDCPTIECIVLYRATTSLPLYLQMIGRGSRVTDIKDSFIILDFGMNVQRFGYWHIDRTWSLDPPKKKSKKKDSFPVKFCPECGAIVSVNVRTCDYCGFVWVQTEKERVFAELQELSYADVQKKINEAATVEEMEVIRIAKGYKVGHLLHKFKTMDQFKEYETMKGYKKGWSYIQAKNYLK